MADVIIRPAYVSTVPDTGDPSKVGPNAWNAARVLSGGNPGDVVTRDPAALTGASWIAPPSGGSGGGVQVLARNTTIVSLPPSTGSDVTVDLWSQTIPANTIPDGAILECRAWGFYKTEAGGTGQRVQFLLCDSDGLAWDFNGDASSQREMAYGVTMVRSGSTLVTYGSAVGQLTVPALMFGRFTKNFAAPITFHFAARANTPSSWPTTGGVQFHGAVLMQY